MKKKLNKVINETNMGGITSNVSTDVSTKVDDKNKTTVNVPADKLKDTLAKTSGLPINVNIVENNEPILEYVSNVYGDDNEIEKPFEFNGKNYQRVRAKKGDEIVEAIYSIDEDRLFELNSSNEDDVLNEFDYPGEERAYHNKLGYDEDRKESLKKVLSELGDNRHFIINTSTGEAVAKFKGARDLVDYLMSGKYQVDSSNIYMNIKELKAFKFNEAYGDKIKEIKSLAEELGINRKLYETENKTLVLTKSQLTEMVRGTKTIKVVKIKDINKNG